MSTKSMHKLISVIVLITLLAAALPVPAMAAEQPGDVVPYELAPAEAKQHVLASKTPQTRTREPLAPHATSDLVSIDWYADTSPDGQGAGRLDGVLVTFTSTDGTVNGGELAMSADWATLASTDGVPGIDSPRIVDEGIALDWNAGAAGTAKISFGAATVTDPILLFGSTDDPIQTFDFDDGLSLTLLDQNPTGTTILAGNVISTSGGHTNAASDGFAVQIQGTFSEISFATNTNLAAAQSVMVTVAAEAQNIRRPTPSSPALVMPNFVSAAADYNDTGTYTSTFAIPAGAKYAQFSNYTFPIDTDTSGGIEEDWYATTAFADLAAAEVSGVAAMWRADVDAWEVEYAFQGTPFGTNTMDSPNFEGDTNPRHINYNVTASGGNFMIAEESTLADLRGTYLTEFYDTDESMTLLASDQIFFYANMSQGQQEIPVDTDVIIIDAYFGPYNASSDQNQEENFATGRLIIDLGDNSVVGRLASIDSRTDDALFNYGFTRTNVDSVAPGGLTTSADPSLSRTGDYTLTSSANWLYDPDIYVTDETTLTIDHAPVGSTSTFTDTNAGSYFIQYFDRQETPSPNVFLGATANATGSGAHLGIGTIGTAAYGYVTTMGHNSGPGDPFDDDKYFSYSLLDMEHGISSGHYTRIQGWQTIGSQYRDGKAWHDIPLSTAINGYTTTDEILRTYALSLDYAANEITFDSDNFVRWGIDKAAVAFWFGPPPTCPGDVCDDLALWLRADMGTDTTVDGADISAWQDQSIYGNNASPGGTVKLPDYYGDQINGNPIARFDGNHDHMDFYSQLGLGGNDPFAIYSVFKIPDSSNYRTIIGPGTDANHNNGFQYRVSGTGMELVKEQDRLILSGNGIVDNGIPQLTSLIHASPSFTMYLSGGDDGTATDTPEFQRSQMRLGDENDGTLNESFLGDLAEVILYNVDLTAAERNRVDTYLALKYGITLTDTQGISYTLSDGTSIVWDADDNDTYHNDVAGIVIDAGSALTQTQSRSVNPGSLVTITGNIANMADGHALVWGNNAADATTFDQSAGAFVHMARVWKVQEQGDVGAVTVAGPTSATYVLVSSSTDFSSPTVHNVGDDIDFNDGQYFTFAQDRTCSLISSTFDTDNEGWSTTPDGQIQAWNGTAGNPGGAFLVNDGQTGGWFDYVAPAKFLGDQSIFYGGTLNFDLYVTAGGGAAGAAQISDGTTTLSFGGATSIGNYTWTSYTATLTAADWGTTEAEMRQVLSNLAWIWIQGEYIGIAAHGRLDNVFMTCPPPPTPGGVSTDLDLWLKADAGVYANAGTILATDGDNVLQWHTQAGNITTEAQIAATSNITYETATANFNPVVQFDGTSLQRLRGLSTKDFSGAATILLVAKDEGTPNDVLGVFSSVGTPTANAGGQGIYAREHGKYIIDGQGAWDPNSANTTLPSADRYRMVTGYYSDTGTTQDSSIYLDGGLEQNYTGAGVPIDSGMTFEIGGRTWGVGAAYESRIFTGEIAEVIYYGKQLDAADQNKAESYLALKYGITLISGTQGISYTLSDDMVVWNADANAAYHNDVAGISIDGGSALAQTMSRSINDDSIVTIGMPADLDDGEALVWGNDNGVLTGTTEVPATYYRRLAREWLVQETDDAGNVYIDFDLSGISDSPDFGNVAGFALLVDSDGDFGDATAITAAGVNGSIVYFNNVSLADGDYFSLAYPKVGDGVDPITGIEIDYGPGTPGENAITATLTTGEPVSYTWDISGTIITDNPISYTFPGPGVYPCVLTVTNPISEVVHPFEIIITGDNTLSIDKTAEDVNGAPLEVGDELLYTVVVTNNLSGDHPGVVITDAIPANTTYVPASASVMPGSISNTDPVVANVGTLPGGGSATLTFRVSVDAGATGETIQNSAVADSPVQEPEAQVGPIEPPGGGLVGPTGGPITGIEIDYGPGTPGENAITGTITTGGPATYTWDISGTIIIDNPITYTFPGPGVYPCVLTVTNPVSEVVKPFEIIITGDSTLGITKTAEDLNNAPLYEGDELLYTVVVTNLLSGDHPGVVITDAIPANTTYVPDSASVVPGSISSTDPVVANVGTLPGGGSATLTFRVSVDAGATDQEIQNSAVADSPVQEPQVQVGPIVPPGGGTVIFPTGRPLAVDDAYDVPESVSAQPSSMLMVLENDSDPDGDIFTIVQITAPAHGTAAIAEGGGYIIYTPTADYLGADTFGYTINDGVLEDSAVVTLNVLPVADLSVDGTYRGTISTDNFTLMVRNDGPRAADGAVVTMSLPVSYTVSSCDADGVDCMANIVNNVLSDTLTLMPSGSVVTYTLTGSMPDSRESSTAVVMPPDGVFDVVMENNIDVSWTLYKVICPITAKNATF